MNTYKYIMFAVISALFLLSSCSIIYEDLEENENFIEHKIELEWDPSPEVEVNSNGGGYVVYYAKGTSVDINTSEYVEIPYSTGMQTNPQAILSIKLKDCSTESNPCTTKYTYSAVVVSYATFYGHRVYSKPSNKIMFTVP